MVAVLAFCLGCFTMGAIISLWVERRSVKGSARVERAAGSLGVLPVNFGWAADPLGQTRRLRVMHEETTTSPLPSRRTSIFDSPEDDSPWELESPGGKHVKMVRVRTSRATIKTTLSQFLERDTD